MTELRRIRREKGISIKELASAVGVAEMTIYRYERGWRIPDAKCALKIASMLGCTVDDLFNEEKGA